MSTERFFEGFQNVTIAANENVQLFARVRNVKAGLVPIVLLIHGYPQSSWEFRYATQYITPGLPLFVPDLPGYGESTKSVPTTETEAYTKHAIGRDILDGLAKYLGLDSTSEKQRIVIVGHDRGARISQRIAFDIEKYPLFDILGVCLADIVPITLQWQSLANPLNSASTFHWPFLAAKYPIPESMIEKYGGPAWAEECLTGWAAKTEKGLRNFLGANGIEVFKQHFTKKSVIDASCADYRAAAHIDSPLEAKDHAEGKRIGIPTLVLYSKTYLGSRYDVPGIWANWVSDKTSLTLHGFEEIGHFCFEEDPEASYTAINGWISGVLKVRI